MKNLNAEEIKKALECCDGTLAGCEECPNYNHRFRCNIKAYALALIKSQEQRIKELEQCWEHEHASATEIFGQWSEKCEQLTEENERLKKPRYFIKSDKKDCDFNFNAAIITIPNDIEIEMIPTIESVRADTVRKMQERLKGRFNIRKDALYPEITIHEVIDLIAEYILEEG